MARAPTMVIQDDYIDMDLTPASPKRALLEFEFQSTARGAVSSSRHDNRESAAQAHAHASPADELFYRGKLLPLHLPPRLQLVQKLLQEQQVRVPEIKPAAAASASVTTEAEDGKAGNAKKYSWSKRLKLMKRWTSREYIRSFFLARPGDIGVPNAGCGSAARGGAPDQDEACGGHRRSFSGIIRRVRLVVATKTSASTPAPGTSPLCSSSSSSSSASTPSCGNAERFFLRARAAAPALKRSSSAGSEEGGVHGAIAHCKRSHQQLLLQQGRKSASGVVFYSLANTPRISTSASVVSAVSAAAAAAANEPVAQERQEICRG